VVRGGVENIRDPSIIRNIL